MKRLSLTLALFFCCFLLAGVAPVVGTPAQPQSRASQQGQAVPPGSGQPAQTMTDIIDIKPPVAMGFDTSMISYALIAAGCVVLAVLIFLLARRFLKSRRKTVELVEPLLAPWDEAKKAISEIEAHGMGDCRRFYFGLTSVFKEYVGGRFGINAPEMTTEELLPRINGLPLDRELAAGAREFLRRSDLVKFAGACETDDNMAADLAFVKSFVEKTEPSLPDAYEHSGKVD